ncbi:uncharacterized protein [Antedon mediterranea]|uniref:uncharacterized protein n=1 Tax=Antedon mediterranea TaxID=105859 RepID=UPI003AF74D36
MESSSRTLPPLSRNVSTSHNRELTQTGMVRRSVTVTIPGILQQQHRSVRQVSQIHMINKSIPPQTPDVENTSAFITSRCTPRSLSPIHLRCQTVPSSTNFSSFGSQSQRIRAMRRRTARPNVVDVSGNVVLEQKEYLHLRGVKGFFPPVKLRCKSSPASLGTTLPASTPKDASPSTPAIQDTMCPQCREPLTYHHHHHHPGGDRCRYSRPTDSTHDRNIPAADSSAGGLTSRQYNEQKTVQQEHEDLSVTVTNQLRQRDVPWVKAFKVKRSRQTKMNELMRSPSTHDMYHKWRLAPSNDPTSSMGMDG